ncbi:N-acetylmuramoyl-L-alanine amidase [Natronospira bacteriovora]|uniref:N-acetylmuramoyl-L-alanine amidase n=1 Tax=Natronospira bacteriovora TaxID=3069753 RepID=A0ABU0W5K6_9GAMM|nr:N-acetylmuramoyl-L-alanine amidase [Natronospira sp. AB-CW4]MDQ2069305.1 N-acetylmuramoyl-L-alanine amidase [Natronospira sp. AB-CW4]
MRIIERHLPAFCYRDAPLNPEGLIVHWISVNPDAPELNAESVADSYGVDDIWNFLVELNRPGPEKGPIWKPMDGGRLWGSYHYLISRAGDIYQLVPPNRQAYHAGKSEWRGRVNCNGWTLGVALAGGRDDDYEPAQYEALAWLTSHHGLGPWATAGHDEVAIPQGRRQDPGRQFDWQHFRHLVRQEAA